MAVATGTDSGCGELVVRQDVCLMGVGVSWAVAEPGRQGKIFLWVPVSSPPQTHCHYGPESLGEGAGTEQIFPLGHHPGHLVHLMDPTHPEGNSSPKSCPAFSRWPASSALWVGEFHRVRGHHGAGDWLWDFPSA